MLRPLSMEGGSLHSPIWAPYAKYATVDYIYGWKAFNEHNGFTAAQGSLNAIETAGYLLYLWLVYKYGAQETTKGRGAPDKSSMGSFKVLSESRTVHGQQAAWAVLVCFSMALLTFSKTVLYCMLDLTLGKLICQWC